MHRGGTLCLLVALLGPATLVQAAEYQYTTISPPGAQGTVANGINNEGQIVGYYFTGSGDPRVVDHAFLLSGGVLTPLADPQGDSTTPASINDAGQIAGSYNVGLDQHAFVLNGGAYSTIDPPGRGPYASANGINNSGRVIGYYTDPQQRQHEFQYADGQFVSRDAPNSGNTVGFGINDARQIVGWSETGTFPTGFLATPVPEPSVFTPALAAAAWLVTRNRTRLPL